MNTENIKQLKGDECEDLVLAHLTGQGWKVFTAQHGRGMADLILFHEDDGCITLQVKTLTQHGGPHVAKNGLVMEGPRPRIKLPLKDGKRYYKDNNIDWMVGVDPDSHLMYFYPHRVYKNCKTFLLIDKVASEDFPDAPELEYFKKKKEISNLNELLD